MPWYKWLLAGCLSVAAYAQMPQPSGKALFEKRCTGCHALDADREGPRLRGVMGRPAASVKAFGYSKALQDAKFTWDEAIMDKWLSDTESVVPNNDMSFRVPKQDEREAIIRYLNTLSSRPDQRPASH